MVKRLMWSSLLAGFGALASIAANQIGAHPGGHRSGGRSMIVDPWGLILAQAPDREGHAIAELDLERQLQIREQLPSLANRRPAAYAWPEEVRA